MESLRCLVYPANFKGRSVDVIDDFLEQSYDALILTHAARIKIPDISFLSIDIDYVLQEHNTSKHWFTPVQHPYYFTMTSIRKRARTRYGPEYVPESFRGIIQESIMCHIDAFKERVIIPVHDDIEVRAQSSYDKYCDVPGEYTPLALSCVRLSK